MPTRLHARCARRSVASVRLPIPVLLTLVSASCVGTYVRGRVTDCRDATPIDGADVQLTTKAPGAGWESEQTGGDGAFVFKVEDRSAMPVILTAAKRGYQTAQKMYSTGSEEGVCMRPTSR